MSESQEFRVLVCGGRNYVDEYMVDLAIWSLDSSNLTIIHGGARGADSLAGQIAEAKGIPVEVHHADWETHGKAAGFIRNQKMLDSGVHMVLAFPGGAGTEDMKRRAKDAGVLVLEIG